MKKVILITGASSGIGESLALEWSQQKNVVLILAARGRAALEKVAAQCKANGAEAVVVEMDLSSSSSMDKAVAEIYSQYPEIDVVIHNGGISQRSFVHETSMEVYRRLMEVNFFGYVYLTQLLLPKMRARKSGQFVVVSSVMGKIGTPFRSGYAASKHALHGFFDCLRAESVSSNIQVTMVCPGFVRTAVSINALLPDGTKYGKMAPQQEKGMAPDVFAKKMIRAVECKKEEVYIGGFELVGVYLKRFCPKLLSKITSRIKVA